MSLASVRPVHALPAVLLIAIQGCIGLDPVRIESDARNRLKDEPAIHVVQYEPAELRLRTRLGDALRSANRYSGTAPDSSHGVGGLAREYALADPVLRVRDQVVASLSSQLGLANLRVNPVILDSDEPETLRSRLSPGVALDFRTLAWLLRFDPNRLFSYFVFYLGRARLIRLDSGQVIWQGICQTPSPAQGEPTLSQLQADGGVLLRAKSSAAADRCATELLDQFFGRQASRVPGSAPG